MLNCEWQLQQEHTTHFLQNPQTFLAMLFSHEHLSFMSPVDRRGTKEFKQYLSPSWLASKVATLADDY
jgi:hypothetical protein